MAPSDAPDELVPEGAQLRIDVNVVFAGPV
jgi:hypothetical protein